jgi:cell wall-associated NlpC family hydrolase
VPLFARRTRAARVQSRVGIALIALLAIALSVFIGSGAASAAPGATGRHPAGSHAHGKALRDRITSVNARLNRLSKRSDQLDERYDVARATAAKMRRAAQQAQTQAEQAQARYATAHRRFIEAMTQQYEGGGSGGSVGSLLVSRTPENYLTQLSLSDYLSRQFGQIVHAEKASHVQAEQAAHHAATALEAAKKKESVLAGQRRTLHRQSQRFHQLLDSLTAQQRRERARARALAEAKARAQLQNSQPTTQAPMQQSPPAGAVPVSGNVQRVISFAEAQVGKSYSYGAAGPDSYDCSGLTMAAWAQAGVHLPHSAAGQYNYGTHVSYSQLQPGDLIFLYQPIGHVELYVGHDLAVSAADPSEGIVYVHPSQDMGDYTGATRLSG